MTIFVTICIYAMTSMALNLLIGFGGQISVGHAGFLSVGGYSVAILSTKLGLPFIIAFPASGVITAIIGLLIGLPAVRLSGHFLAVVTLGFGISVPLIALNWDSLTGGYSGVSVSRPEWLSSDLQFFYVVAVIIVLSTCLLHNILKGRMGRAFIAIRESEVAAQATGINISFYKTLMFVISAFFTGLAGGLYGYWFGFVSPNDFTVVTSFLLLAMIVVGGLASLPGAMIGAVIFTVIPELTRSFIGATNIMIGAAVVLFILFRPLGFVSLLKLLNIKKHRSAMKKEKTVLLSDNEQGGAAKSANL
ncbi:branched-chain amino acid ABC transporter permease [Bacillus sp. EB600]|nr:branched-chain amino acid ABC transporter permease [Bacillus sp. EB600]